jgi:hypothetical protein
MPVYFFNVKSSIHSVLFSLYSVTLLIGVSSLKYLSIVCISAPFIRSVKYLPNRIVCTFLYRTSWLTLLLRIREVPVSNIGPETSNPD